MRALAISDLHFGAWTGDPVLAREFALRRLEPRLEGIDELVLLGDVFDFLFSTVEHAFEQADRFFELIGRKLQGRSVVFLAGNHDHHIAVRGLRSAVELQMATGAAGEELERTYAVEYGSFFQRFMDRRLAGVEGRMVYPTHRVGDVLLTHGHYLDVHMAGSVPNRVQARATRLVAGVPQGGGLGLGDY
jgi:Calcineurin-like phosphoesterase